MIGFEDALFAATFAFLLNAIVLYRIKRSFPWQETAFLRRVYVATLLLRYALAVFLNLYLEDSSFALTFWGDSSQYDREATLLASSWSGEVVLAPLVQQQVSGYGFYYFVAFFYYVFGRNTLLVQFVNGSIGAITVIVIYAIARQLFDSEVARWAARFMAFFPQMIFWSAALYKDPAIMLCIATAIFALLVLRERFSFGHLMLFVAACLAILTLRFYVFYFVAFATLGTFVFAQRRGVIGSLVAQLTLVVAFLAAFSVVARDETLQRHAEYFRLERVQVSREDLATAGSGFAAEADVSTPEGALAAIPVGFVYLMFAPFPWAIQGLRQALTLPETLVWYSLMPALVTGTVHALRHRLRAALPIFTFAVSLTLAYSLFQGNVGTAYRQRTQITMFFFIFMGVGIVEKRRRKERLRAAARAQPLHA
jgi:4-amino-4-deoxy-L-arabinose transferase-like glycosyltransferase